MPGKHPSPGLATCFLAWLLIASLPVARGTPGLPENPPRDPSPPGAKRETAAHREPSNRTGRAGTEDASPGEPEGAGEAAKGQEFDPAELEGQDAKVAGLAAHRLLQAIASKEPKDDASRVAHLNYLLEKLHPTRLAQAASQAAPQGGQGGSALPAEIVCAERIVDALATWVTSSGPPFSRASEVVQPLLGLGPATFRDGVMRAHKALATHELRTAKRRDLDAPPLAGASPTLSALAARFTESPPPPESFLRDAAAVLWETDGKTLLSALVGVLALHAGALPGTPASRFAGICVEELQSRVLLSFPTLEAWQKWWSEARDLPLEKILADCQRRARAEYLTNWKQVLRRLRETGDAERLYLAIQDTLDGVYGSELRVAAVSALGDFAEWVLDMRWSGVPSGENDATGDPKDRLLAKAVGRLAALFERASLPVERPEVLRAALSALRKYHSFLERSPLLLAAVSRIVSDRIQELSAAGGARHPQDLLETIRLAGALRVGQALGFLEALLRENKPSGEEDLELLTTAVNALGRLLESGASGETASLLVSQFRRPHVGPEKVVRELRRACVTALSSGSPGAEVQADLRGFFKEVLLGAADANVEGPPRGEKELRIPAILGLGTLARQKDTGSFEALIDLLARGEQFEPQEVVAAIDSIAYVGGRPALAALLRSLDQAKDKSVEEHLWKKILGLVEAGGGPSLTWTLEAFEARAFEEDSTVPLEHLLTLCASSQVKDLVSTDKVDPASDGRLESLWKANMSMARAQDLLGKEEEISGLLSKLSELVQKIPDKLPDAGAALSSFKATLAQRSALKAKLARAEPGDGVSILKELDALLLADPSVPGRWRNLRWILRQLWPPAAVGSQAQRQERIRALWQTSLASEQCRPVWEGFPVKFRERFLARVDALGTERK